MNKRELNSLVKYWQGQFNLQDWKIKVFWKSKEDMKEDDGGYCAGRAYYAPEFGSADVWILCPEDRDETDDSIESDVIHELLHILLEGHKGQSVYDARYERALNIIAKRLEEEHS